jgi:glycosyltransferase involved in cell wall biosynthesis
VFIEPPNFNPRVADHQERCFTDVLRPNTDALIDFCNENLLGTHMRILFALPGLHRIDRGAEVAFISVAEGLSRLGHNVTLAGSGYTREGIYRFIHVASLNRARFERFPSFPFFRNETAYEELSFMPDLLRKYNPSEFDLTATCSFPYVNLALRRPVLNGRRPPHVFVTQNGDWPAQSDDAEYRFFGCEGLVCTNPDYFETNKNRWNCSLIPNGVDTTRFTPDKPSREKFGIPTDKKVVLMVSAFIASKRVDVAVEAVSRVPNAHLVVAGDGPQRAAILAQAKQLLPDRFTNLTLTPDQMPDLYRSADIFLHMSYAESFGNVFLEAMASGLPIVAHNSPRLRWIIGDNGYLLDTNNIADIARCLSELRPTTPKLRQKYQAAAQRYDWSNIAVEYEQFFSQVVNQHR